MPAARPATTATTAMRPTSPLSPRFEGSRYDSIQSRQASTQAPKSPSRVAAPRRQYGNNLTLPGLPKFHPANYPSAHSSFANTPASGPNSPVLQQRFPSQGRPLYPYQSEYLSRSTSFNGSEKPTSPKLRPLGSPGPVTPLELASADGYMSIMTSATTPAALAHPEELATKLAEAANQRIDLTPPATRPPQPAVPA